MNPKRLPRNCIGVMQCLGTANTLWPFLQGARKCDVEGRYCIEKNYARTFNCNTTCDGVYADIHMIKNQPVKSGLTQPKMDLESKDKGADKAKFEKLIDEYRQFKRSFVQHYKFSPTSNKTKFGQSKTSSCVKIRTPFSGNEFQSTLQLVEIYFDTATFDKIERDKKIKTEAQLSLIGGTMGLLTGFSIISGIEIIYFLFRLGNLIELNDKEHGRFMSHC